MIIASPKDEQELRDLLYTGLNSKRPFALRYPRGTGYGVKMEGFNTIEIGSWEILDEGRDIAILAVGKYVYRALEVKKQLRLKGFNLTVVNARFIKPMDENLLNKLLKTHEFVITAEDGVLNGGFGSAVAEFVIDNGYSNKVLRFGIPDKFIEHGKVELLEKDLGLDVNSMVNKIEEFLKVKKAVLNTA